MFKSEMIIFVLPAVDLADLLGIMSFSQISARIQQYSDRVLCQLCVSIACENQDRQHPQFLIRISKG